MLKLLPDAELMRPAYIQIQPSLLDGVGLHTTKPCQEGEIICILTGEVINEAESLRREHEEGNCGIFFIHEDRYLDPGATGLGRFLNHSCDPNAIPEERDGDTLFLVALRDIAAGAEIAIDYDFDEIYDKCWDTNPRCLKEKCPLWGDDDEEAEAEPAQDQTHG